MSNSLKFQTISFFVLLAITIVLVGRVFLPYASVLLWSAVFYMLFGPYYHWIIARLNPESRWFKMQKGLIASLFSVGIIVLVGGMMFFFVIKLVGQGQMFAKKIVAFVVEHPQLLKVEKTSPLNELVLQASM